MADRDPLRILFVAMAESVHVARWIQQLEGMGWDLHLFSSRSYAPHEGLRGVTLHSLVRSHGVKLDESVHELGLSWPLSRGWQRVARTLERLPGGKLAPQARLARLLRRLRPDIVHSLEMQHAGYLTLDARQLLGPERFPPWIYSAWGSDMYYFARFPDHKLRIEAVLRECDYLVTDCERDAGLARELGFEGEHLGVFPGPGGFDLAAFRSLRQPPPVSGRRLIMVKADHLGWASRAHVAVEALRLVRDRLAQYEIVFHSNSPQAPGEIDSLSSLGVRCTALQPVPHTEFLRRMGRARVALGVNISDGTPNTMLEAMAMGALPIQSDTVSTREWIRQGENGFLVPPEDPVPIAAALRQALDDDALVEEAARVNDELTARRIDRSVVRPRVLSFYERIGATRRRQTTADGRP